MTVAPIEDRQQAAIVLMVGATFLATCIDSCAKWLVEAGMPAAQVVFVRYAVHLAIVLGVFWPTHKNALFRTGSLSTEMARAIALLATTVFNFIAVRYLPLTMTAAIFFTMPLWVCVLSVPMLGERVGIRRWGAIFVGFCGILIVTRPWDVEAHWAMLLSLGMAVGVAFYGILSRRLAGVDSIATQQFYASAVATIGVAPFAFSDWRWPQTDIDWAVFAVIGFFGWGTHQLMTLAHRFAPASTVAPFGYIQILFMTASSWIIFHAPPDAWVVVGATIVVLSGLYIWLRERQISQRTRKV